MIPALADEPAGEQFIVGRELTEDVLQNDIGQIVDVCGHPVDGSSGGHCAYMR